MTDQPTSLPEEDVGDVAGVHLPTIKVDFRRLGRVGPLVIQLGRSASMEPSTA